MKISGRFDRLDQKYLEKLVRRASAGDSNAFAELFAAVCDRQLYYLMCLTGSREVAAALLRKAFITAYSRLPGLSDPGLFMVWMSRISAEIFIESEDRVDVFSGNNDAFVDGFDANIGSGRYQLGQIMSLPIIESQILLMHDYQHIGKRDIAEILNFDARTVRRFLSRHSDSRRKGRGHEEQSVSDFSPLSVNEISEILEEVYERNGSDINNIPVADLSLYTIYRSERFNVQRAILAAGLIIFMLLPLCFVLPEFTLTGNASGRRGLPEYDVKVSSWLPVHRVIARIGELELPVYEADSKSYTVEPTGNGNMAVSVELFNRQKTVRLAKVDSVDSEGPHLTGNTPGKDTITLTAEDSGIGIDYHSIYAENKAQEKIYPISADESQGIVFDYPEEDWDIYIPDRLGNTLHLSLKIKGE